jgi:hypothetical protein
MGQVIQGEGLFELRRDLAVADRANRMNLLADALMEADELVLEFNTGYRREVSGNVIDMTDDFAWSRYSGMIDRFNRTVTGFDPDFEEWVGDSNGVGCYWDCLPQSFFGLAENE